MTDHLRFVRDHQLRDLTERLDGALTTLTLCEPVSVPESDDLVALINRNGIIRIENAITEAVAFLHEMRMKGIHHDR